MTTATLSPAPAPSGFAAITAHQRRAWARGDQAAVAAHIPIVSELLCDSADLVAGSRVLDVAGGSGNTALAAARRGARVVSLDYVPSLLLRAAERAEVEGLRIDVVVGDAQDLPFPDASFDAVVSSVGVMFAPDHHRAADEMLRVCRPGGTIALASWTPGGFIGQMFRVVSAYAPPPPAVAPPSLWGTPGHVRALLGDGITSMEARRRHTTYRFETAEGLTAFFRRHFGPMVTAFAALPEEGRAALAGELTALARRFDRIGGDGPVAIPAEYLEVVATRA